MKQNNDLVKYKDVLICGEVIDTKISTVTEELLRTGRDLSDKLGESVHVLLIGTDIEEAASEAIACGADKVHLGSGAPFEESSPEHYLHVVTKVCARIKPRIVLFGQTDMGRDIAPRMAGRLNVPVTLDCIRLDIDPDLQSMHRTTSIQ